MRSTVWAFILVCGVVIGALTASYMLFAQQKTKVVSPVAEQSTNSVLGEAAIPTPTLVPSPTPSPRPTPVPTRKPTPRPTRTPTTTPVIVTSAELETLFTKYAQEYSVDKELLKRIANCESGMNSVASNRNYAGLFQFSEGIWTSTRTLMGQNPDANLRSNAEEAIRTAAFMVSQKHLYIWPNCNK